MKILFLLLSDQHVPNLLSVHKLKPDRIVFLESAAMRAANTCANFIEALACGGLDCYKESGLFNVVSVSNVASLEAIRRALREAYALYPAAQWLCNVTGGTKIMSMATYEYFRALGVPLFYIEQSRPDTMIELSTEEPQTITHKLSLKEFCAGYGYTTGKADTDIEADESRNELWLETSIELAACCDGNSLLTIPDRHRWRSGRERGLELQPGELQPPRDEVTARLTETFGLRNANGSLTGHIDRYAFRYLSGEWLNGFTWGVLRQHANVLGIWDLHLGFSPQKANTPPGNDFDVSFMHNYALCMVECKTGSQEHDPDSEIIYKVDSVTRQFRALRTRPWLVTTSDTVLNKKGTLKESMVNRAANLRCTIITRDQVQTLAENFNSADVVRRTFWPKSPAL